MKIKMIVINVAIDTHEEGPDKICQDVDIDVEVTVDDMEYLRHNDMNAHNAVMNMLSHSCSELVRRVQ